MKTLLLFCLLCISVKISAQTETSSSASNTQNKYLIKINPAITYNIAVTTAYIKQVCAATTATLNTASGYFEVLTKRTLEKNIIEGKLQKNATPMSDFIYVGEIKLVNSTDLSNPVGTE